MASQFLTLLVATNSEKIHQTLGYFQNTDHAIFVSFLTSGNISTVAVESGKSAVTSSVLVLIDYLVFFVLDSIMCCIDEIATR